MALISVSKSIDSPRLTTNFHTIPQPNNIIAVSLGTSHSCRDNTVEISQGHRAIKYGFICFHNMNGVHIIGIKALFPMLSIMENPNSIILIDEIENGFHYSMFPMIWEAIAHTAQKSNCQVIATTHSYECVTGAVEGIEKADMKDQFCFFRLAQEKKGRCAYRFSSDVIRTALDAEMEVR